MNLHDKTKDELILELQKLYDANGIPSQEIESINKKLTLERNLFQKYLNLVEVLIVTFNKEGCIEMINRKGCEILGYNEGELIGKNWFKICLPQPDGYEQVFPVFEGIMAGNLAAYEYFENEIITKTGTKRLMAWHNSYLRNEHGAIDGVISSGEDITERKAIENAFKESEEKFRLLFNQSPDAVTITNSKGEYIDCNATALAEMNVASLSELQQYTSLDFYADPADRNKLLSGLNELGFVRNLELKLKSPNRTEVFDYLVSAEIMNFRNSEPLIIVWCRNITDRKQAEQALKNSEEKYRESQLVGNMAHWEYNFLSEKLYWSDQLYNIYGVSRENFEPDLKKSLAAAHPDDQENIKTLYFNAIKNISEFSVESRIILPKGEIRYISNKAKLKTDENQNPTSMLGTVIDITDRKKAEAEIIFKNQELQKLNSEKDKFFTIIAHDLKSPFNTIMGFSELLVEKIKEKRYEDVEEYADIIQKASQKSMYLLSNLMEWARSQTGRMQFNPEFFDLVSFIDDILELFEIIADQKSIVIQKEMPAKAPAFADKSMLSTVLRNLISNAIKFTKPGGQVIISVKLIQTGVVVSVKDTGIGIPKENIEKLFRIDGNISTVGTNNEKGTGFGLVLCKDFVKKHGGEIWVESAKNLGSTFYFSLPFQTK